MKPVNTEQAKRNNDFIDLLIDTMTLKNDAALSRVLEVAPPVISKIRHGRLSVGASMLISAHEESGLTIREMKDVLGFYEREEAA